MTAVITGERGEGPDPAGARGVRLGCGHPARPPRPRSGLDAPPARGQVPRLSPRHERVSVPHRCRRHQRAAGLLAGLEHEAPLERVSSGVARLDEMLSGKGTIAAARSSSPAPPGPGRRAWPPTSSTRRAAGANAACASSSKSRRSSSSEHALHRHRPRAVGGQRTAAVPCGPAVAIRARDPSRDDAPGRGGLQGRP